MNQTEAYYKKMTTTPVARLIIALGIPTTVSMLITSIYNMADTYFVSTLGKAAGGAPGIVFSIMAILQAFGFMFGHGAGSHVSRLLGAKDEERAGKFASTSLLLSSTCGLLIMVFGLIFLEPLMWFLGSNAEILPHAMDYAMYIFIAGPAMTASCVFNNVLRYEGKATFAMIGLTSGGIINIFLDYIFVMRLGMGTAGAGLATAISQYISLVILAVPFFIGKTQSKIRYTKGFISLRIVWDIVTTGFPSLIRQGLGSISTAMLNVQARFYGTAAIAAMGYVSKTVQFIFCVGLGIGQGFQPVAGYNFGAGERRRVKQAFWVTTALGSAVCILAALFLFPFSEQAIMLFRDDDMEVVRIGSKALRFMCIILPTMAYSTYVNQLYQCLGFSTVASLLASCRQGIFFIPLVLILPRVMGVMGIEVVQPAADLLTAFISVYFHIIFFKRELNE